MPLGATVTRPMVATAPRAVGRLAGGQHGGGQPEHRVVAVHQPGGAGVVGLAVEVQPPPAVRPDAAGDADRSAGVDEAAALLDVQLDQGADPAQRLVVAAELLGSCPAARIASASVVPSASVSRRARSASSAPVSSRDPAQAMPNRAPSSSVKLTTPSGRAGTDAAARAAGRRAANALTTPSGPS